MRSELLGVEQQQDVEGVVHRLATPAVAVVPLADALSAEPWQFRREHVVQIAFGVAADGGVAAVQRDVLQVVQPREQAHFGELANAGEQRELDVRVVELDGRIEAAQVIAVGTRQWLVCQCIQDGFVVLVHQPSSRSRRNVCMPIGSLRFSCVEVSPAGLIDGSSRASSIGLTADWRQG